MKFVADKCAYCNIERGEKVSLNRNLELNGLQLTELLDHESYKYLGQDENISINTTINKERVTSEYFKRVKKIWESELFARNKINAHNVFALPVLTPTFGIIKWTKDELNNIDIKTRKILTRTGSFHRNSDIDRLYCNRDIGGRGINSVADTYASRIVSLSLHLVESTDRNKYLEKVILHESDTIIRQANEFRRELMIDDTGFTPKQVSLQVKTVTKKKHYDTWMSKPQHSYLFKSREKIEHIDKPDTNRWLKKANLTSHEEGYYCAIQEEEINTRGLQQRRSKDKDNEIHKLKCRICHKEKESIQHILACCEGLRIPLYLPVRHNAVAKVLYKFITESNCHEIQEVYKCESFELWWDTKVTTKPAVKHNKPDMIFWKLKEKKVYLIDVVIGLDVNVAKNYQLKIDNYLPLSIEMQRLYPEYSFEVIPIVIGATGLITNTLRINFTKIGIDTTKINKVIELCQKAAMFGSMKIVKSVMSRT